MTENKKMNIYEALCKFQSSLPTIEQKRKGYNYTYANLSDIWEVIRKPLADNGFSLIQLINTEDGNTYVITKLCHVSGETIESRTRIEFTAKKFQEVGTAYTYYRRYALSSMLGIVSDEDVDSSSKKQIEETYKKEELKISNKQLANIENLINGYDSIRKRMLKSFKSLNSIPASEYEKVVSAINKLIDDEEDKMEKKL